MLDAVIFELRHRGDIWRLEVVTHAGRTFCNLRRWTEWKGQVRPTKDGLTFSLDDLPDLHRAIGEYLNRTGWSEN